ncbi:hypothetical protein ACRALDRAFT_207137 [Sodiomyces alcalophilus JCM 7366]|uniref:uncharacterized protein n=1 Tax=Sodiomyces alcalophilus JCM 7366 TaxID=591952 RepID=UPI0039B6D76B
MYASEPTLTRLGSTAQGTPIVGVGAKETRQFTHLGTYLQEKVAGAGFGMYYTYKKSIKGSTLSLLGLYRQDPIRSKHG